MDDAMTLCDDLDEIQTDAQKTLVQHQIELEKLYSKNQTLPRIRA